MTRSVGRSPGWLWQVIRESTPTAPRVRRVAVCHDWLTTLGGADKVASLLSRHYSAELFAAFAVRSALSNALDVHGTIVASRLNRIASSGRNWQVLLPVMPMFWRSLDLSGFDVVFTSSHSTVNAITAPDATRICYCHTPMRYAWDWREERSRLPRLARPMLPVAASAFRRLDRRWSRASDVYVANSTFVAERIERAYGRSSIVIHPPIDTELWCPGPEPRGDYFLVAGRLVGYKKPMIAVEAARRIGARVVVAGDGPALKEIERLGDPNVQIIRSPGDEALRDLYRQARALVFPGVEDFGMTLLEAQACGTPVIARAAGGALDSVVEGVTGVFVNGGTADAFAEVLREFNPDSFDRGVIRKHAERFGTPRFLHEMDALVERQLSSTSPVERGA